MFSSHRQRSRTLRLLSAGALLISTFIATHLAEAALYPGQYLFTGAYPAATTQGDFDGDGITDLAVISRGDAEGDGDVHVFVGNGTGGEGDGTYRERVVLDGRDQSWDIATADLDGDGALDLVVTVGTEPFRCMVWLGKTNGPGGPPTGGFDWKSNPRTGDYPVSVVIEDFDGDTTPDLAVANYWDDTISILLGNGDGTFVDGPVLDTAMRPIQLVTGDFNGDGTVDLAAACFLGDVVSVFVGQEGGTPVFDGDYDAGPRPISIVTAAMGDAGGTADTLDDLAMTNYYANTATILSTNGPGQPGQLFPVEREVDTGEQPRTVGLGDITDDGILDLVVGGEADNEVKIYTGTSSGSYGLPRTSYAGLRPFDLVIYDSDSDGHNDVIVTSYWQHGLVTLNGGENPDGTASGRLEPIRFSGGSGPLAVAAEDIDQDGFRELIAVNNVAEVVTVLAGTTQPVYFLPTIQSVSVGSDSREMVVGNYNTDILKDVIVTDSATNSVFVLQGDSLDAALLKPSNSRPTVGPGPVDIVQDLFSNDANVDPMTGNETNGSVTLLQYNPRQDIAPSTFPANGVITYELAHTVANDVPDVIARGDTQDAQAGTSVSNTGDLDNDGAGDLVVGAPGVGSGEVYIYYGGAAAGDTLGAPDVTLTGQAAGDGFGASVAIVGDVNNDGHDDLVVGAPTRSSEKGRAYLYSGASLGSGPELEMTGQADGDWMGFTVAAAGDVNEDTFADFMVAAPQNDGGGQNAGRVYLYFGGASVDRVPDVTFDGAAGDSLGIGMSSAGDFNNDGHPDLIMGAPGNDEVGIDAGKAYLAWGGLGILDGTFDFTFAGPVGARSAFGWSATPLGDFNGDGIDDLAVGAPLRDGPVLTDIGSVVIYFGSSIPNDLPSVPGSGLSEDAHLGISISAVNNLRGRGQVDLIAGAPGEGDGGVVYAYNSSVPIGDEALIICVADSIGERLGAAVSGGEDFDADGFRGFAAGAPGNSDLAPNAGKVYIYSGGEGGSFGLSAIANGDLNNDGRPDIVAVNPVTNQVLTAPAVAGWTWADPNSPADFIATVDGGPKEVAIADLDDDGNVDLVIIREALQDLVVMMGNGDGTFGAASTGYGLGPSIVGDPLEPSRVQVGDMDGDDLPDAVVTLGGTGTTVVLAGQGDGTFGALQAFTSGKSSTGFQMLDFDGDGSTDLIVADFGTGKTALLFNRAAATGSGSAATGNEEIIARPLPLLAQNYPNPFNPTTTIRFDLPKAAKVKLVVFDVRGRQVIRLRDGYLPEGDYRVDWNGRDGRGHSVATGVYLYRLTVDGDVVGQRKMVLAK